MNFTIRVLGAEVLHLSTETAPPDQQGAGDVTSSGFGFVESAGDQRWEKGPDTMEAKTR